VQKKGSLQQVFDITLPRRLPWTANQLMRRGIMDGDRRCVRDWSTTQCRLLPMERAAEVRKARPPATAGGNAHRLLKNFHVIRF